MKPVAAASGVVAGAAALGAAYWRYMSPSSQSVGPFPSRIESTSESPQIALTFDDGPNEPYTSQVLELLDERGVRATFFQVGRCVQRHPGLSRAMADAGHVVGSHTFSHTFSRGWSEGAVREEIRRGEEAVAEDLGRRPLLYRPPWLIRTPAVFRVLAERGLNAVSGEFCHPLEPLQPAPERLAHRAVQRARPGRIIIFHDGFDDRGGYRGSTVEAVARFVDALQDRDYAFVTVDRLLGLPAYED